MDRITEYVYVVMCDDPWIDYNFLVAVFKDLEGAEKYKAKMEKEGDSEYFYTIERAALR